MGPFSLIQLLFPMFRVIVSISLYQKGWETNRITHFSTANSSLSSALRAECEVNGTGAAKLAHQGQYFPNLVFRLGVTIMTCILEVPTFMPAGHEASRRKLSLSTHRHTFNPLLYHLGFLDVISTCLPSHCPSQTPHRLLAPPSCAPARPIRQPWNRSTHCRTSKALSARLCFSILLRLALCALRCMMQHSDGMG